MYQLITFLEMTLKVPSSSFVLTFRQIVTQDFPKQTQFVGKLEKVKNNVKNFDMFLFAFDSEIRNGWEHFSRETISTMILSGFGELGNILWPKIE